jgi:beta-xylosidase
VKTGSAVLYRLGESIEHTPRKYRVHPPKDFGKWADICCAIIRHYNEGWADGFRYNIRYWEIWNEPENQPAMWTGTDDQYFQLYEITAKAIKARWPDLKVGGPSLGYTGEFKDGQFKPGDFLLRFLRRCRDRQVPLDFFSWHRYASDPSDYARRACALRQLLDAHGFTKTESHFNEWNYLPNEDWRPMM